MQDELRRVADVARASAWWLNKDKDKDDEEEDPEDNEDEEVEEQKDDRYRSDPYRADRYGTEPRTIALQMMVNAGIRKEDGALALATVPENPGNTEMCASTRHLLCQQPPVLVVEASIGIAPFVWPRLAGSPEAQTPRVCTMRLELVGHIRPGSGNHVMMRNLLPAQEVWKVSSS